MEEQFTYEGLYRLLEERRDQRPEGSYTTYLFEKGLDKILKKVGEECTEVIIAAKAQDHRETVYELSLIHIYRLHSGVLRPQWAGPAGLLSGEQYGLLQRGDLPGLSAPDLLPGPLRRAV